MIDWAVIAGALPDFIQGLQITLLLLAMSLATGFVLAIPLATMRVSRHRWLSVPVWLYTYVIRGTPLLVQLIIIYTGLPQLGLPRLDVLQSALLGLVLNEAAYLSEILRGGILSVPTGQKDAALALGLSRSKAFVLVTMPQAMRVIVPALGNSVNGLLKTTSIASVISMEELLRRGQILMQQRFEVLEIFVCVAIIYLVMTTGWEAIQRRIEAHYGKAFAAREVETKQLARDDR